MPQVDLPLPSIFYICATGILSPSTLRESFKWARPDQLADPLALTNQVAFAKCVSECLDVPPPIALSVIFNSPLYHLIFPGAGA